MAAGALICAYFKEVWIEGNLDRRLVQARLIAALIASEALAAICPYSMAFASDRTSKKFPTIGIMRERLRATGEAPVKFQVPERRVLNHP